MGISQARESKAHMRKPGCHVKESLLGGPSRVSSSLADHPTAYEKFVIDKYTKVENKQKRYLPAGSLVSQSPISRKISPL